MKARQLRMRDGSTVEINALDIDCEGCKFASNDSGGVQVCSLWQRRDTWGSRLRECIDAEIKGRKA